MIITLTSDGDIIRCWSQKGGTLLWDASISNILSKKIGPLLRTKPFILDLSLDLSRDGAVVVLSYNSLLSFGLDGDLKWTYSGDATDHHDSSSIALSRLIPYSGSVSVYPRSRVAVGCRVTDKNVCLSTVVLTVNWATGEIFASSFPPLSASATPSSLNAVLSSASPSRSKTDSYAPSELVYTATQDSKCSSGHRIALLGLLSGKVQSTCLPLTAAHEACLSRSSPFSGAYELQHTVLSSGTALNNSLTPAVLLCSQSPEELAEKHCSAVALDVREGSVLEVNAILTCKGPSAVLGTQRVPTSSSLSTGIFCAALSASHSLDLFTAFPGEGLHTHDVVPWRTEGDASSPITRGAAPHLLRLFPALVPLPSGSPSFVSRVLLQTSVGELVGVQGKAKLWSRGEALSRVRGLVVVDHVWGGDVEEEEARVVGEEAQLPTVEERLHLQLLQLTVSGCGEGRGQCLHVRMLLP